MSDTILRVVIGDAPPPRLDKALARDVPEEAALSRSRLVKLIAEGAVAQDGVAVIDQKARVEAGDVFDITLAPAAEVDIQPEAIPLEILYEDDDLLVVNKPAGMVVHPAPGSPSGTLVNALLAHCGDALSGIGGEKRPGIVHRIDKDTSGLLVVSKSDRAHHGLAAAFEAHDIERRYHAVVYGVPDLADPRLKGVPGVSFETGGTVKVTTQLARHKTDRQRQAVLFHGGRHAVTRFRVDERFGAPPALARITCQLETGRTHQIRVHMAHVGHGLIGDPVYGRKRKIAARALDAQAMAAIDGFSRQALHAATLGFVHPVTGESLRFEAPYPADFDALVRDLRL